MHQEEKGMKGKQGKPVILVRVACHSLPTLLLIASCISNQFKEKWLKLERNQYICVKVILNDRIDPHMLQYNHKIRRWPSYYQMRRSGYVNSESMHHGDWSIWAKTLNKKELLHNIVFLFTLYLSACHQQTCHQYACHHHVIISLLVIIMLVITM